MYRTRLFVLSITGLVVLLTTTTVAGAAVPAKTVSPKQCAAKVCPAIDDVITALQATGEAADRATSRDEVIANLQVAVDDAIDVLKTSVTKVKKAGTPDAKRGAKTARTFVSEFKQIKKAFSTAANDLFAFELVDPGNLSELLADTQRLVTDQFDESFAAMAGSHDRKVDKALEANSSCQALSAG